MMPGSRIVIIPSSDVGEYSRNMLRNTISHIVNPTRKLLITPPSCYRAKHSLDYYYTTDAKGGGSREIYKSENCPSWWPKDVLFSSAGIIYSHRLD